MGVLVLKAIEVLKDVPDQVSQLPLKAANTVHFLSILFKYFSERVKHEEIILLFEAPLESGTLELGSFYSVYANLQWSYFCSATQPRKTFSQLWSTRLCSSYWRLQSRT